jgi:hypothetical protein
MCAVVVASRMPVARGRTAIAQQSVNAGNIFFNREDAPRAALESFLIKVKFAIHLKFLWLIICGAKSAHFEYWIQRDFRSLFLRASNATILHRKVSAENIRRRPTQLSNTLMAAACVSIAA